MNWLNTIFILALAYLGVFLEGAVDWPRNLLGAQITVLPALMVYASLTGGIASVALLAVCGGLWLDSLSANPLGVSILPLFGIGFILLQKRDLLLREHPFAQMALGMGAGVLFPLGTLFLLLNLGKAPLLGWRTVWEWAVAALSGGVLTPVCFWFFDRVRRAFEYPALKQSSFRPDREIKRGRM
jgi:cell shape-determining protein MreD